MPVTYVDRIYYRENQYKKVYRGNSLDWAVMNTDYFYVENLYNGLNTITLKKNGTPTRGSTLEWSGDLVTWTTVVYDANNEFLIGLPNLNQKVYFRSTDALNNDGNNYYNITASNNFSAGGDMRTLINYTNSTLNSVPAQCFRNFLRDASTLVDISNLDVSKLTIVNTCSFTALLTNCTNLVDASSLIFNVDNAANSAFSYMFENCSSLVYTPRFNSTGMTIGTETFRGTFRNTAITTAPTIIVSNFVTGSTNNFRDCFYGCSNLTDISGIAINATDIPTACFINTCYGCLSLTKAVPMTVNTVQRDSFNATYEGCIALNDITGFVINATEYFETTFRRTFYNCTSLTKALPMTIATLSGIGTFNSTYDGCSSLSDISGVHITATTAGSGSFKIMFRGTAITESPDLSSLTTLYGIGDQSNGSFAYMFQNCANLKKITVGFSSWNSAYTYQWVNGVSSTGDFYNLGGATISSGNNGRPSGWTEHKGTIKIKWYDDNQMKYTLPSEWDRSNNGKVVGIAVQDNDRNIYYTVSAKWARIDTPDTGGVNGQAMVYGDNTVSVSGVTTTTTYSTAISDYNGKVNTTALLANTTAQPNWRTDSTITSSYAAGYQPAACCCWRFYTLGTNQGDWYLPAAGELNSSYEFRTPINNALLTCSSPILWDEDETTNRRWSSTQYSSSKAWHFESGQMINWNKTRDIRVRPFGDY